MIVRHLAVIIQEHHFSFLQTYMSVKQNKNN